MPPFWSCNVKSGSSSPTAGPVGKSFVSGDRLVGGSGPCGCVMRHPSVAVHTLASAGLDDVPAAAMRFPKLPTEHMPRTLDECGGGLAGNQLPHRRLGDLLLVRKRSPNPPQRTFALASPGKALIPCSVSPMRKFSGKGLRNPSFGTLRACFAERVPQVQSPHQALTAPWPLVAPAWEAARRWR